MFAMRNLLRYMYAKNIKTELVLVTLRAYVTYPLTVRVEMSVYLLT